MTSTTSQIRARVFDGMREFLAPYRLSLDPLLKAVGISPWADFTTLIPLPAVGQLFEIAAAKTGEPCFGIKYALAYPPGGTGPLGQLVVHAPTLRDAVTVFPKYASTYIAPSNFSYHENGDSTGCLEWVVPLDLAGASLQFVSFSAALATWRLRSVAGENWQPLRIDLTHRELQCTELAKDVFGASIRYDQPTVRITIDKISLDRRAKVHNHRLYNSLIMAGEADLTGATSPGDIITRVRRKIHARLTEGAPELDVIAAKLHMQARALQWQLSQAGTSFERVLSDTRRMIAESMLASSELPLTEVAQALGFNDQSSLNRACKAWFDMTPTAFRDKARNPDAPVKLPKTKSVRRAGQEPADD